MRLFQRQHFTALAIGAACIVFGCAGTSSAKRAVSGPGIIMHAKYEALSAKAVSQARALGYKPGDVVTIRYDIQEQRADVVRETE